LLFTVPITVHGATNAKGTGKYSRSTGHKICNLQQLEQSAIGKLRSSELIIIYKFWQPLVFYK